MSNKIKTSTRCRIANDSIVYYSMSVSKYLERRIIRAWKSMTRKPQRASVMMEDFVILNARRRSVMFTCS
jgi:hypothetical protein